MARASIWVVTLRDSKPIPNWMIGAQRILSSSKARLMPKLKEKISFHAILVGTIVEQVSGVVKCICIKWQKNFN